MKALRVAALIGALMLCLETSSQKPPEPDVLPREVREAIEQTPCPEASGLSPEACLLWLSGPNQSANPDRIARELAGDGTPNGAAAAVAREQETPPPDGLRGRSKN